VITQPHDDQETESARDLRHLAEEEQLRISHQLKAAAARTAEEWMDIFWEVVKHGVKQTLERAGDDGTEYSRRIREQQPFVSRVRADFKAHALPLTEEVEFEGPTVQKDAAGSPHIVEWPRGVWILFHWPEGGKSEDLRFEGQAALVALAFILWWGPMSGVGKHMAGKDAAPTRRIVEPGSSEYMNYITAKGKDLGKQP